MGPYWDERRFIVDRNYVDIVVPLNDTQRLTVDGMEMKTTLAVRAGGCPLCPCSEVGDGPRSTSMPTWARNHA